MKHNKISKIFLQQILFVALASYLVCAQNVSPKIIGGFNVTIEHFKHQVSIRDAQYDSTRFGSGHLCGGSLIDYDTVLTASHCVHNGKKFIGPKSFVVVMGNVDLHAHDTDTFVSKISKVIGHAKYNPDTFENDIAILKLVTPVPKNHPTVEPIPLSTHQAAVGLECQASGFGTTEYKKEDASAVRFLMAVNLTVNARTRCNSYSSHAGSVTKAMFCAGPFEGGKDTCQGDSGGPFTCNGTLVGVTSHGFECALPNYPGIYMDVAYYRKWILRPNVGDAKGFAFVKFKDAEDTINVLTNLNNKKIGGKNVAVRYAKNIEYEDDKSSKNLKIPALAASSGSFQAKLADKKSKIQLIEEQLKRYQNAANDFELDKDKGNSSAAEPLIKKYQFNKDAPTTSSRYQTYYKRKRKPY